MQARGVSDLNMYVDFVFLHLKTYNLQELQTLCVIHHGVVINETSMK